MKDRILSWLLENKTLLLAGAAFLALGMMVGQKIDNCKSGAHEVCAAPRAHPEEEGHDHSACGVTEKSLNDLGKMRCEHGTRIVDCDACRFEAGVVKIDPSIASLIETGQVQNRDRTKKLALTGQVQLDRTQTVDVVSTGGGRVEQVLKRLGEKVTRGEVLAVIHSADFGRAKADFLEVQARLELVQAAFQREQGLYEKKITSQAEYQNAANELRSVQASLAAADKKLRLFGLGTEQLAGIQNEKENGEFADLALRAPQNGTLIAQNLAVGKMADTAESLYTIANLSNVWVWCDVYEKDLAILHERFSQDKPLQAIVRVKAFDSIPFEGAVDFVGPVMDEHTRTVKMRVQVKNPEEKLRPGMFADVDIAIPLDGQMPAVPKTAVMTDGDKRFVFQHWKEDLWVRRDVAVGGQYGPWIEILSGVPNGATVVTGGAFMLKSDVLREKMGAGCAD